MSATTIPFPHNTLTATRRQNSAVILKLPASLERLLALLEEGGADDYGEIGPAQFAFWRSFKLVADAIAIVGEDFAASPSVDSEGGIRVTWKKGDRTIKLVCPKDRDQPVYVYHASPHGQALQNDGITASVLAERLSWLINREP
jgi:hypothetical protein